MFKAGTRVGPYEIAARVGAGGMGEVYRALDTRLGRDVAVKILTPHISADEAGRKRFLREAQAISALSHPNICSLYDIGHENGHDFLVMEFLEGETLAQRLLTRGALSVDEAVPIAIDIASALDRAHRKGIIHRDLKPANVMLTANGAKLLDFGLARLDTRSEESAAAPLTTEGVMIGTMEYMSPEQLNGQTVDARSDIFAFGVLLYEMLTGVRPFRGLNRASVIGSILFGQPEPLPKDGPEIPPPLERLVNTCLEKDPDNRIQTSHDLRLHLQWTGEGSGAKVPAVRRRARVFPADMVMIAVATFLTGFVVAAMFKRATPADGRQIRFTVTAPIAGQEIDWPVLSPDGKKIGFVVEDGSGERTLWVRDLASLSTKKLAGTEGATQPFWSNDGGSICFFSAYRLQVARLDGTRPQSLAAATSPRGGSWSPSGAIVYTPQVNAAIWTTSAAGTEPRALTQLSALDVTHRWPEFLPDGEHFVFVIRSRNPLRSGLYVTSVRNSRTMKKVAPLQSRVVVTRDGWLLFMQDRKLLRQRFDLASHELVGQPVVIAPDVSPDLKVTGAVRISASHDGLLAFKSSPETRSRFVRVDRGGKPLQVLTGPGHYVNPALSPDGQTLAFSKINEENGRNEIWLMDARTGAMTPFIADDTNADAPVWTFDGTKILYTSDRRGAYEIWERPRGSVAVDRLVVPSRTYAQPINVSRTGMLYHFATQEGTGTYWFKANNAPLGRALSSHFANASAGAAELSRDGRWITHMKVALDQRRFGIEVVALDDPERRLDLGGVGATQAAWRADSRELYYVSVDGYLKAVEFSDGQVGATTSLFRLATRSTFYASEDYVALPDGREFIVLEPIARPGMAEATVIVNWAQSGT